MNSKFFATLAIPFFIIFVLLSNSLFVVNQAQQTLLLEFGKLVRVIQQPGLYIKIPFIQDVITYDKRILDFDITEIAATLGDQKRVIIDTFARYRIVDPALFFRTVHNEDGAEQRLRIFNQSIALSVLGKATLTDVLSERRSAIALEIRSKMNEATKALGIDVIDLRLKTTDLPPENSEAIFNRMISERKQEAQEFRSRGDEIAQEIKSAAEKERTIILADSRKQSEIIRGQGDAYVTKKAATIYGKDAGFYNFYRTMNAYKKALPAETTTYILSPSSDILKYFHKSNS